MFKTKQQVGFKVCRMKVNMYEHLMLIVILNKLSSLNIKFTDNKFFTWFSQIDWDKYYNCIDMSISWYRLVCQFYGCWSLYWDYRSVLSNGMSMYEIEFSFQNSLWSSEWCHFYANLDMTVNFWRTRKWNWAYIISDSDDRS